VYVHDNGLVLKNTPIGVLLSETGAGTFEFENIWFSFGFK
jgi:hypothetical protein